MKKSLNTILLLVCANIIFCQVRVGLPAQNNHPRFLGAAGRESILENMNRSAAAKNTFEQEKKTIDKYLAYCETDSAWMLSRLQMYWKTKSTQVFIKGGTYDHAEGQAPVPTVKFPGMRGGVSAHSAPKLEDITPYMDDPRGVYFVNKSTNQMEWVDISKTGNIIESINNNIMRMAYSSSALYYITAEDKYAKFAFSLFDTYMTGMQYRREPYDLSHGHHQTLAGLSTFEVIQEVAILNSLTGTYDFLYNYIQKVRPEKNQVYTAVFRKWAEIQIAHGVAFNNWDLMEAKNTLNIALMLDDDNTYADKKGNQYYTNFVLNINTERQWSLQKIINEGYDKVTGMWFESPGYSANVLNDFTGFVTFFDKYYNYDLLEQLPVLKKSIPGMAQYLFPNGYAASFGDAHYSLLNLNAANQLILNARKNSKPEQEKVLTQYIKTVQKFYNERGIKLERGEGNVAGINSLLYGDKDVVLDKAIEAYGISEYITPVLFSSNVSFFALRNSIDKQNGLMVAMSGSKGNHMHANGISMEMYGKGYVLAPESGIGTNYFQADYAEYYSQFPAHNTVAVDGISAYPVMKSNHGFDVVSSYPKSGEVKGYFSAVSFGDLYFLEPETNADQRRLTSIVRTSDSTGYYIDIFRSKRKDGKDKLHDYFYHNIGQELVVNDNANNPVTLQPTEKLSFSGGHLFAYDYLYDKKSVVTQKDITAVFKLTIPGKNDVFMNMWIKGEKDREIFAVKSPRSTAIDRMGLPKDIADLPMPAIVVRQTGEAWTKPFAAVFEPATSFQPKSIISIDSFKPNNASADFIGLTIESKEGSHQFVFSSTESSKGIKQGDKKFTGIYAVISETKNELNYLFLGNGNEIAKGEFSITAKSGNTSAALELNNKEWFYTSDSTTTITFPFLYFKSKSVYRIKIGKTAYTGKKKLRDGKMVIAFELPSITYSKIDFK